MIRRFGRPLLRGFTILAFAYGLVGYLSLRLRWLPGAESHQAANVVELGPERVVSGVISIHTEHSHDATGSIADVARAARAAGLHFAVIGDHPPARDPWVAAEYHDSVLIGFGMELILPDAGRALLFGMADPPDLGLLETEGFQQIFADPEATAVVIHGRSPRERERWRLRESTPMHAWEVMDLSESARRAFASPWSVYHAGSLLLSALTGTTSESLVRMDRKGFRAPSVLGFDSISAHEPLTAIAGLNHHPKAIWRGRPFPDYEPFFQTLVNHVVLEQEEAPSAPEALRAIGASIRAGRVFVSVGNSSDARNFRFAAINADGRPEEGGEPVRLGAGLRLRTSALQPERGSILFRLLRDGREIAWLRGSALDLPLTRPGVYRVEVYHYRWRAGSLFFDLQPWIFSNPVRVTA